MGKKVTSIRVDPEIWEEFKNLCEKHGKTMGGVLRELILKWIEQHRNVEPPRRYKVFTLPAGDNRMKMEVVCECGEVLGQVRFNMLHVDIEKLLESLNYKCPHCGRRLKNSITTDFSG